MRQQWEFLGGSDAWYWRVIDRETESVVEHAGSRFDTLFQCIKDAELHGYSSNAAHKRVYRLADLHAILQP